MHKMQVKWELLCIFPMFQVFIISDNSECSIVALRKVVARASKPKQRQTLKVRIVKGGIQYIICHYCYTFGVQRTLARGTDDPTVYNTLIQ